MSNHSDLIGKTLGTCTLVKLLGKGGMGVVYLAQQTRPARPVAIKVLMLEVSPESTAYKEFLVRFRREADVIAKLEHINIMPIYEYGEQDNLAYLVMPYLSGGSLRDVLAQRGALSLSETATYLDQAAYALTYAHSHGVIHRDIKPSNFLIHSDGRLVLADFGIARIMQEHTSSTASSLTSTGMLVGTPDYMAPEMAHGEQIDQRADIYELGILLFQMLTGRVPFTGSTPLMVAVKHIQEPLPSLSQMNPAIPPAVDAAVMTATAKRREDRYMSALDLAQAFRIALNTPHYVSHSQGIDAHLAPGSIPPQSGTPQQIVVPTTPQRHDTPPPIIQPALPITPVPASSEASRGSISGVERTISSGNFHASPDVQLPTAPKSKSRILSILIVSLLVFVITAGATFFGIKIIGGHVTSPSITTTPTTGVLTTPTTIPTSLPTATTPPTPTPMQQAGATVQHYFDDINIRDYSDAYNFLGSNLQNKQTYSDFVSGFSNTEHDNIQIGNITSNSDGTFNVSVTINATEDNVPGPGTHISIYQGYYIVGMENGQWKLLDASFKKVS
ncbi:MAG TPA: serine/threonine-protein kinase [Ktedonobacteraceae bacterium]